MTTRHLLLALGFLTLLVSCKSKPTLVGTWTGSLPVQGIEVLMTFRFGSDGTLALTQTAAGQTSVQAGSYKELERSFTFTPKSIEGAHIPKATVDQMNAMIAANPQTVTFALEWKDADTVVVTQQGAASVVAAPMTLKRGKT
ncbi:MAG TPA: hypothetical protein PLL78_03930 [Fimbriimonadaceae bacterium]|nr:hypothetical protein [Fimbriimonadaceae bacterium]HRJ95810.1 hypothetical protein [Fimbriimonadaceae bacterium]